MSAQTQRRTNTRVRTGGARRAMSADQALTRAQERKNSKIDAAITAGRVAQLQKSMNVTLKLTSGGSMRLVSADGTVSPEGRHYYSKLGVEPPSIFPYEQGWRLLSGSEPSMAKRRWSNVWEPMGGNQQRLASNTSGITRMSMRSNALRGWSGRLAIKIEEEDRNGSLTKKRSRTRLARSP